MEKDKFAKVPFFKDNPEAAAITTKLIHGRGLRGKLPASNIDSILPNLQTVQSITSSTTQSMNDVDNIFEVLPDTELAMQILVSSILSPNDMRRPELTWSVDDCELPAPLVGSLLEILRSYFEDDYKIKKELPKWLENALFLTGSYAMAIIPESSLDDLINQRNISTESLKAQLDNNSVCKSMGILGNKEKESDDKKKRKSVGIESLLSDSPVPANYDSQSTVDTNVFITDHYGTLKLPQVARRLIDKKIESKIHQRINASLEALQKIIPPGEERMSLRDVERTFYADKNSGMHQLAIIKTADQTSRATIGHPLAMRLPSDSVIPVHVPGDPETHVGYFVLLDEFGNPLSNAKQSSYYREIAAIRAGGLSKSAPSNTLQQVKLMSRGLNCPENAGFQEMAELYGKALERDLLERLRNGIYGNSVDIAHAQDIYQVMLARSLSSMRTQLIYIPAALMLYVAFDYNKLGIGRSLLDKSKTLASIRAVLLFSNTMAAIKNSTNQRKITIELDPEDPEPDRTVETLMTELAKVQSQAYPLATTSPTDIINGIRNAATNIVVKGNPLMPEVSVDVEDRGGNRVLIDTELDESIKNRYFASMGLTPELVDSSTDVEFAAEIVNRNLMFTKRLAIGQEITEGFIVEFVRKFTENSGKLKYDMIRNIQEWLRDEAEKKKSAVEGNEELVNENGEPFPESTLAHAAKEGVTRKRDQSFMSNATISEIVEHFLHCLQITLPKPDDTKLENQLELMNGYSQALDVVLPYYVNQETLEQLLGDEGRDYVEPVIQMVRGYFMRDFIAKNNIMPELQDLISKPNVEEEPLDILSSHVEHANGLAVVLKALIEKLKKKNNPNADSSDADGSDTFGSSDGGDGGDTFGSDDAFGADDDESMSFDDIDTETEDTTSTEEEEPTTEEEPAEEPAADSDVEEDDTPTT